MMPGLWIGGVAVYLGFGPIYAAYLVIKLAVILGAHCAWAWDAPLYRIRALHPLMWVLERTISTPATHWAHHALTNEDGIGHYKGNFGNLLFFWDVLFGTAHITRKYPARSACRTTSCLARSAGRRRCSTRWSTPNASIRRCAPAAMASPKPNYKPKLNKRPHERPRQGAARAGSWMSAMALLGHGGMSDVSPLLGASGLYVLGASISLFDPKRP